MTGIMTSSISLHLWFLVDLLEILWDAVHSLI